MDLFTMLGEVQDLAIGLLFGDSKNALLVFLRSRAFNAIFYVAIALVAKWPWRLWKRWRRNVANAHILEALRKSSFVFGNVREPLFVADFCMGGYKVGNIKTRMIEASDIPHPSECNVIAQNSRQKWQALLDKGTLTNNTNLRLAYFAIAREGDQEHHQVTLSMAPVTYIETRISADVWLQCLSAQQRADFLIRGRQIADPYFSKFFGITLAVILDGNEVLVMKRSEALRIAPGKYVFGVSESMSNKDIPPTRDGLPDMHKMARRGLAEECGIILQDDEAGRIRITSLVLDEFPYEWQMMGYVDLREKEGIGEEAEKSQWWRTLTFWNKKPVKLPVHERFSFATIAKGIADGRASDKYEHDSISSVPFNAKALARFMDKNEFLHPHIVNIILTLLSSGQKPGKVEDAFTRYYRYKDKLIPMPGERSSVG